MASTSPPPQKTRRTPPPRRARLAGAALARGSKATPRLAGARARLNSAARLSAPHPSTHTNFRRVSARRIPRTFSAGFKAMANSSTEDAPPPWGGRGVGRIPKSCKFFAATILTSTKIYDTMQMHPTWRLLSAHQPPPRVGTNRAAFPWLTETASRGGWSKPHSLCHCFGGCLDGEDSPLCVALAWLGSRCRRCAAGALSAAARPT